MVARLSEEMRFKMAKTIAKDHGYFIVEKREMGKHQFVNKFLLYREDKPRNQFVGKRTTVVGIYQLVKKVTGHK